MSCLLVVSWGMMFGHVVSIVFFARGPVMANMAVTFSVAEPMVFHVHCFEFLDIFFVDNAKRSGAVRLLRCRRLRIYHEFKGVSCRDSFAAVDLECADFGFSRRGHDRLVDLGNH